MILPCVERGREAGLPNNLPIDGHSFRRVEVLTGVPRRRRWSAAEKAAIVAESLAPGAVASTVALRHGLHRNQLYMWRRELRSGVLANRGVAMPDFVPILPENRADSRTAVIEIEIGGAVLRADVGVDLTVLGRIIRLLKAT
jgi:transposase